MFDFLSLKKTVGAFTAQVKSVRAKIDDLKNRRDALLNAPCTREDFKSRFNQYFDVQADRYMELLCKSAEFFQRHPKRLNDDAAISANMTVFGVGVHARNQDVARTFDGLAAALLPELRVELARRIDVMPWPEGALPLNGRENLIAAIDTELEALTQQESQLVSAARSAGLIIE